MERGAAYHAELIGKDKKYRRDDMKRIDEKYATQKFVADLLEGKHPRKRFQNNGANYSEEKEKRDTQAVKEFAQSKLFQHCKEMV